MLIQDLTDTYKQLFDLPKMGIFAFINQQDKIIYLSYSKNILTAFCRNVNDLKYSNHIAFKDANKLKFEVIDIVTDKNQLKFKFQYWYNKYNELGYSFYKKMSYVPKFKVKKIIEHDIVGSYYIYVKLLNSRGKGFIVGVFNNMQECDEFMNIHYSNNIISNIVFADNILTRKLK